MAQKVRIVIAGMGGVGGYFGGILAKHYHSSEEIEIIFFARGQHLKEIKKNGLTVIKGDTIFTARAHLVTGDILKAGQADFIIVCTKDYDLDNVIKQLMPCIGKDTILLPLLNGINASEKISKNLQENVVLKGCVYIVSGIKEPGVVENKGNVQILYFGQDQEPGSNLIVLKTLLANAGIEVVLSSSISNIIWEKFIFLSPVATATTYFNTCIGDIITIHEKVIVKLIKEVLAIATARGIAVDKDIVSRTVSKMKVLPYHTTSSMHRDFQAHKQQTELHTLTGYVVAEGYILKIATPVYNKMYEQLKDKEGQLKPPLLLILQ